MTEPTTDSNAISNTDGLDDFSAEFFGKAKAPVEPVEPVAPVPEDADDTSPSDADDTKPEDTASDPDPEGNSGDDDTSQEPVTERVKKKTAAERISEITALRRAAEDRAALAERELAALRAAQAKPVETTAPRTADVSAAPNPDEFLEDGSLKYPLGEYDPQYLRDNVNYLFSVKEQEMAAKAEEQKLVAAEVALQSEWENKLAAVEKTEEMSDIRDVGAVLVSEISDIVAPQYADYLAKTIMSMENGPEVFYYLATNLDEAKKIAGLDVINATIALGAVKERLAVAKTGKEVGNIPQPRVSKAPEPPVTVNRGSNGKFETPDDTDNLEAFAAKFFKK